MSHPSCAARVSMSGRLPEEIECFEVYANALLREFGSADRALAAARAVVAESPDRVGYPMLWRQAALAVELCRRHHPVLLRAGQHDPCRSASDCDAVFRIRALNHDSAQPPAGPDKPSQARSCRLFAGQTTIAGNLQAQLCRLLFRSNDMVPGPVGGER
jgi:hypothetical protein